MSLPVIPELRSIIDATEVVGTKTWLVTEYGAPFTANGFGNWFRDRCVEAGVPGRAHELRKAAASRLGEKNMQTILTLLGGLGIGSSLTTLIAHLIARRAADRSRLYQEKREAYLGLLDALHRAAVRPSDENAKNFALWQTRCDLFGSAEVSRYARAMVATNDNRPEREIAFRSLVDAMRIDLAK